jgi:hypothetical protein
VKPFQEVWVVLEGLEEPAKKGHGGNHVLLLREAQPLTTKWSSSETTENTKTPPSERLRGQDKKRIGRAGGWWAGCVHAFV